jgi:MerC mercury resistance protein
MPPELRRRGLLDRVGAAGSLLCAAHCALLPLLIALLPTFGVAAWLKQDFEVWFVLFATLVGVFSMVVGYRRHRAIRAFKLLLLGLSGLWIGVLYPPLHASVWLHALVMAVGGTLVALAHLANLRLDHAHVHGPGCAHGPGAPGLR